VTTSIQTLTIQALTEQLGQRFGILATASTSELQVIASNTDVAVGDLFLLPSTRGAPRIYIFRATEYANVLSRQLDASDIARNKLTMPDSYFSESLAEDLLLELRGSVLGYAQHEQTGPHTGTWTFHRPRRLPDHFTDVYRVDATNPPPQASCRPSWAPSWARGDCSWGACSPERTPFPSPSTCPRTP